MLVGPTGIGKTHLSLILSEKIPAEIVSADSRQIYKFLDIGTAKPDREEMRQVPHHLIDFLRPDEYFSAGKFSKIGRKVINQIFERGRLPIVVGGSGLYVRALIDGLTEIDVHDKKIRNSLRKRLLNEGPQALYEDIKKCDPVLAEKIQPTDSQRILRGLEVYLVTGMKLSRLQETPGIKADFNATIYGLRMEREKLYDRINSRVDRMMESGFIPEVVKLMHRGYKPELNALNTVGYKEAFLYLNKQISYDEMLKQIKQNTRRYAKRQCTWFRAQKDMNWILVESENDYPKIANRIIKEFV